MQRRSNSSWEAELSQEGTRADLLETCRGTHSSFGIPSEKEDKNAKTVEELDEIAVGKWEVSLSSFPPSFEFCFFQSS